MRIIFLSLLIMASVSGCSSTDGNEHRITSVEKTAMKTERVITSFSYDYTNSTLRIGFDDNTFVNHLDVPKPLYFELSDTEPEKFYDFYKKKIEPFYKIQMDKS